MTSIQQVYNTISKEFDKSRFSVWSGVKHFLDSLENDSLCADIGCGNGKNMLYRSDLTFKGYDISEEFVNICNKKGLDVIQGDILNLQIKSNEFDNTISIAVIHHLKTIEERVKAIFELLRITKNNGKILIYVWAFEQPSDSCNLKIRKFNKGDNYIPFQNIMRFYHIYEEGELEKEIKIVQEKYNCTYEIYWELGNWCCTITKK
jgi:SAM-dependent methyltransferase